MSRGWRYVSWVMVLGGVEVLLLGSGCKREATGPDLSNPKAAAITFAVAMENGDVETAKNASKAGGLEVDLVEAMTRATAALRKLGSACKDKFGEAGTTAMMRETGAIDASVALRNGVVDFDGDDAATVTPTEGKVTVPLRRQDDGSWKVDIGALVKGDDITGSVPLLNTIAQAAGQLAPEVEQGKYKTPQEVKQALGQKMIDLSGRIVPASVFPSSQPAMTAPAPAPATAPVS